MDPDTSVSSPAAGKDQKDQPIHLAPYESRIFVFSDAASHPGSSSSSSATRQLADLSSDWNVSFPSVGKSITEATLTDWTSDPATLHYSGEAVYTRNFSLAAKPNAPVFLQIEGGQALPGAPNTPPQEHVVRGPDGLPNPLVTGTGPGMHAFYNPPLHEAALVILNGRPAGALWHPPYRLDVSKLLEPGSNRLEIHVYNTAPNAWSALPRHDYKPLIQKYGDRFQMQDLDQVRPIPSGVLGPIHLVQEAAE